MLGSTNQWIISKERAKYVAQLDNSLEESPKIHNPRSTIGSHSTIGSPPISDSPIRSF